MGIPLSPPICAEPTSTDPLNLYRFENVPRFGKTVGANPWPAIQRRLLRIQEEVKEQIFLDDLVIFDPQPVSKEDKGKHPKESKKNF